MNILLIEDDAKTADFIAKGFMQSGFTVTVVSNGNDGLAKLLSENFDSAVVDVMLPGISGFELMDYIRGQGTPVIFITAKNAVSGKFCEKLL